MKAHPFPAVINRITVLLFVLLSISSSCGLFHFNRINPYTDFTSDHLQKYDVNKIRIIIPDSITIYPGSTFPIGIIATTPTRKELKTRDLAKGFVNWQSYSVHVEGGSFDNGTVDFDPRIIANHFKISVTPLHFPELKQEIEVPISYKKNFTAYCGGQTGAGGIHGLVGDGVQSLDKNNEWYNGFNGQRGSDGETGSDGCLADVFVKAMTIDNKKLMNVLVINRCDNAHSVYWIDPGGGSLLVDVCGGNGGDGGNGGNGAPGTDGRLPQYSHTMEIVFIHTAHPGFCDPWFCPIGYYHNPSSNGIPRDSLYVTVGTNGGIGGNGGNAGQGGNGGVVVIHLDSSAVQWKNKIIIDNDGGKAGVPGTGGYAGSGGIGAYVNDTRIDGATGYIGANGINAKNGKTGETVWIIEKVKMKF